MIGYRDRFLVVALTGLLAVFFLGGFALVVRSAVQADAKLLESAPKLRVIGRAGVGVDNIDTDAATRGGIVVMNTPGANAVAVAELTVGLMISMARSIPRANGTMQPDKGRAF